MVVLCLRDGPRRFSELRALERDGMVSRKVYDEIPPRVEYTLTDLGRTLLPAIEACREWAERHLPELLAARERAGS